MQSITNFICVSILFHQLPIINTQTVDIVQTAINANFTILVTALRAANLVTTLQGNGPFTVFAPTDAAFNKLPSGTVDNLLQPQNLGQLSTILKYHVINNQRLTSAQISAMNLPIAVQMLDGGTVTVSRNGTNLKVNDATVIIPDVMATNGIIHVIDTVLMPSTAQTVDIVQTAINANFTILVTALRAANLVTTLQGNGPFTVFAPTDAAFNKLPSETVNNLLQPQNLGQLSTILKYHVINNQSLTSSQISAMNLPIAVQMLDGGTVTVSKNGTNLKVNDATVIIPDVMATNGIIHVIDTVLMPSTSSGRYFYLNETFFLILICSILFSSLEYL